MRGFSTSSGVRTDTQAVAAGVASAASGSPVTVFVSLPGAANAEEFPLDASLTRSRFIDGLFAHPRFIKSLVKLDPTNLEVRVLWKAQPGAPSTKVALGVPAVNAKLPLLNQVHEVGADGSVSATPVAWVSLALRGGYFYVHVHNAAPVYISGASVGPFSAHAFAPTVLACLLSDSNLYSLLES
ncbi:MAG: hypothetical protein EOO65_04410 [Methanosarcinales archaeon]|nr:MAG: hypothetical protein EOO65_04410 [Methanosarcinales archaeon]